MTRVNLINGYYVEIDPLNFTLKQAYEGKTKDGTSKECGRTIGYYSKFEHVIERVIFLCQLDCTADLTLELREYVNLVKRSNKEAVQDLQSVSEVLNEIKRGAK